MAVIFTKTLGSDAPGNQGFSFRQFCTPLSGGGTFVRVTFVASSTQPFKTDHCAIAIQGAATRPNVTTSPPVELKFSGASGFNIAAGASITSDWAVLTVTSSDTLCVIFDFSTGGPYGTLFSSGGGGGWFKAGASYNLATVTGFTTSGNAYGVTQIEATNGTPTSGAGSSSGTATASGVGRATAAALASSAGLASISGVGASTAASVWSASGLATPEAIGTGVFNSVGDAAGTADVAAVGTGVFNSIAEAAGLSVADGQSIILPYVNTSTIQKPINCVLAGDQPYKDRGVEYDIKPSNIKARTTVSTAPARRLKGAAPSFTVTKNNRGYS